jgi:flagellar biosynthesis component FlhA
VVNDNASVDDVVALDGVAVVVTPILILIFDVAPLPNDVIDVVVVDDILLLVIINGCDCDVEEEADFNSTPGLVILANTNGTPLDCASYSHNKSCT